jgi:DNA-binding NtrC family response regulator
MNVLVVDDQRSARHVLARLLADLGDISVSQAASLKEARAQIQESAFEIAFIDLRLGDDVRNRDGLVLLKEICAEGAITPVIVTGYNQFAECRTAFRVGASDYLIKDDLSEELVRSLVERLRDWRRTKHEVAVLRGRNNGVSMLIRLIGHSLAMQKLRAAIQRVATSDRPVLVTGPTGAGKELVVEAIHALGPNPEAPLLALNCSALPETLLESQVFGHEKGAFTGADSRHPGYLAAVGSGILFLDEIAELPLHLQSKLLRVLEARTFRPLGAREEQPFAGRVVAATHVDLESAVRDRTFREDLFYRLNVLPIHVPSLEERTDDIPALIAHFNSRQDHPIALTDAAVSYLMTSKWPGNIRQLRNLIDRLAVMCDADLVDVEQVRESLEPSQRRPLGAVIKNLVQHVVQEDTCEGDKLEWVQRAMVDEAMALGGGNKSGAARLLGVHRKVVERVLRDGTASPSSG